MTRHHPAEPSVPVQHLTPNTEQISGFVQLEHYYLFKIIKKVKKNILRFFFYLNPARKILLRLLTLFHRVFSGAKVPEYTLKYLRYHHHHCKI